MRLLFHHHNGVRGSSSSKRKSVVQELAVVDGGGSAGGGAAAQRVFALDGAADDGDGSGAAGGGAEKDGGGDGEGIAAAATEPPPTPPPPLSYAQDRVASTKKNSGSSSRSRLEVLGSGSCALLVRAEAAQEVDAVLLQQQQEQQQQRERENSIMEPEAPPAPAEGVPPYVEPAPFEEGYDGKSESRFNRKPYPASGKNDGGGNSDIDKEPPTLSPRSSSKLLRGTWHGGGAATAAARRLHHSLPFHHHRSGNGSGNRNGSHHRRRSKNGGSQNEDDSVSSSNRQMESSQSSSAAAAGRHDEKSSSSSNANQQHGVTIAAAAGKGPADNSGDGQGIKKSGSRGSGLSRVFVRRTWHGSNHRTHRRTNHGLTYRHDFHHHHRDRDRDHRAGAAAVDAPPGSPSRGRRTQQRRHQQQQRSASATGSGILRATRHGSLRVVQKTGQAVTHLFRSVEEFLFPKSPPFSDDQLRRHGRHHRHHQHQHHSAASAGSASAPRVRGGVLLRGCADEDEHREKVRELLRILKARRDGAKGLREVMGLEYRMLPCEAHAAAAAAAATESSSATAAPNPDRTSPSRTSIPEAEEEGGESEGEGGNVEAPAAAARGSSGAQPGGDAASSENISNSNLSPVASWTGPLGLTVSGLEPSPSTSCPGADDLPAAPIQQPDMVSTASTSVRSDVCSDDVGVGAETASVDLSVEFAAVEAAVEEERGRCNFCCRRLYHVESGELLTAENRKLYIADGDMYDEVARLCQEYAFDLMVEEANLTWITVEDGTQSERSADDEKDIMNHSPPREPLRALINADHPLLAAGGDAGGDSPAPSSKGDRPTVLIATGRGKVRAGIFSRQNMMANGLETATAIPVLRECLARDLNILIVDPNVHGDRLGYVAFEKTMDYVARKAACLPDGSSKRCLDLVVLSHSASGGHLARYLLDRPDGELDRYKAIAFTDSTHNIAWCRTKDRPALHDFLESSRCAYFRSSQVREQHENSKWYLHRAGEPVKTDAFWQRRFGKIPTYWAGTNEHSMTNWYAHAKIWDHFDSFLDGGVRRSLQGNVCNEGTGGCAATCSDGSAADFEERKKESIASGGFGDTGPAGGSSKENSAAPALPAAAAAAAAAKDRGNNNNKNGAELDPYHDAEFNHRSSLGRVIQL